MSTRIHFPYLQSSHPCTSSNSLTVFLTGMNQNHVSWHHVSVFQTNYVTHNQLLPRALMPRVAMMIMVGTKDLTSKWQ